MIYKFVNMKWDNRYKPETYLTYAFHCQDCDKRSDGEHGKDGMYDSEELCVLAELVHKNTVCPAFRNVARRMALD